jgi:chromosome segregation protein
VFLKSLTLKGFKSFADKTTLEFDPGIAVVVGPNGSGKSNLVDAVAWVLGAQGPRTLRGGKMDDVIFAGTPQRPALGRAEVSLTIDNSAGLLPIDFSEVTITRTLFRDGDSEYQINGVTCRLLDIQELLSDTGVGRQQHVIVGQGQLDQILTARGEDRRAVIEEAAGILKYRKRKEKAERRLEATEGNLLRLQDLLREVRRQLKPLERQADAARRHADVVKELRALRLHLAGKELSTLQARLEGLVAQSQTLGTRDQAVRERLRVLDVAVIEAERSLSATGGDDLGDAVVRVEALRERARGMAQLLAEKRRSADRAMTSVADASVVESLSAEAVRLRADLEQVERDRAALAPAAAAVEEAEATHRSLVEAYESEVTDGMPAMSGAAAEVRGELAARRQGFERSSAEQARLEARLTAVQQRIERLDAEAARLRSEIGTVSAAEPQLVTALESAQAATAGAAAELAVAEAALRAAEDDLHAWQARRDALDLALQDARAATAAEQLDGLDGVLGPLVDLIEIEPGAEAAVAAALGDAMQAVVVDAGTTARAAIDRWKAGDAKGFLLVVGEVGSSRTSSPIPVPPGAVPLVDLVRSPHHDVATVIQRALADAVLVDGEWWEALDVALASPGLVVVTRDGDRFTSVGALRTGGKAGVGATVAALEEARARAEAGTELCTAASEQVDHWRAEMARLREEEAERTRILDANDAKLTTATDAMQRVQVELSDAVTENDALQVHVSELAERVGREQARVAELEGMLPQLEADEADAERRRDAVRDARARVDEQASVVAALRTELEVRTASTDERRQILSARLQDIEERLARDAEARGNAEERLREFELRSRRYRALESLLQTALTSIEGLHARVGERRRLQSEAARAAAERLEQVRGERVEAERELEEVRERKSRLEIDDAEVKLRLETLVETIRREFDCEPAVALMAEAPEPPAGTSMASRVRELERDLRLMGPINPLALQEFEALAERSTFLEQQLEDVRKSRRELSKIIRMVDEEIVTVFRAAYADVEENFKALFTTLFPGGSGRLLLTDPDDLLNTGIEIEARPSGKNLRRLSLLSGGERSLTAMAYLFAVFRARPSPFYLLDEVEAALDDVNLHRFLDLINEFRNEAQLLIVSHQKRTMEAGDCLYGVSMPPGGSSIVVSQVVPKPELLSVD